MLSKAPTDTCLTDFAVKLDGVSKIYEQWQRDRTQGGGGLLRNFFKQDKKVVKALDQVSFTVRTGEFTAYAGPNGAGKSTTMKLLCGMLRPTAGKISVLNQSPERDRIALMRQVGVLFGNRTELWWDHPVIQSFEWKKVVWDIPEAEYRTRMEMVTECLELKGLLKTFARELSLGQRMRADLALMLLHGPELILLDEPTLGLDVVAKRRMITFLKQLNRERRTTILVTSHDMDDLEEMADRILMIASGRILYDGAFDGLRTLTGSLTRIRIVTDADRADDTHPLAGNTAFTLLPQNGGTPAGGIYEYALDMAETPARALLRTVADIPGVRDIEIKKAPIEEVCVNLYERYRNE